MMRSNTRILLAGLFAASAALVLALHALGAPALAAPDLFRRSADAALQPETPQSGDAVLAATNCRYGVGYVPSYSKSLEWIPTLGAGWYINFSVYSAGQNVRSASFAPVIRVRQDQNANGRLPTYKVTPPLAFTYRDANGNLQQGLGSLISRNRGHYWLVGNEVDVNNQLQDNTMPDVYARAYHDVYDYIKKVDPTAKVAVAGLSMMTPGRLQYLTIVWDTYRALYGQDMPVDIWNMHLYILEERLPGNPNDYGDGKIALGTDPAIAKLSSVGNAALCPAPGSPDVPASDPRPDVHCRAEHDRVTIFREQVYAMRQWMKARGQQNKPLIISEFGLLYPYIFKDGAWFLLDEHGKPFDPPRVTKYLQETMTFLETAIDPNLGYPADGNRLVQQWLWYSVVTDVNASGGSSNLISTNFANFAPGDPAALTTMGQAFRQKAAASLGQSNLIGGAASNVISLPNQATGKATALLTASFRNGGTRSVIQPITVTFYSDQALTKPIGSATYDPATRGAVTGCTWGGRNSNHVSVVWNNLPIGTHQYWVKVDSGGTVPETSEADNVTAPGTVTVPKNGVLVPMISR
jgi:hypothetical protein